MRKNVPDTKQRAECGGSGFTLIEVITILVILGILAVFVAPRALRPSLAGPRAAEIASQLRYLQLSAMKEKATWGMKYDSATSTYWGFNGTDPDVASARVQLPGESGTSVSLTTKGITVSGLTTVLFDQYGIPYEPNSSTKLAAPLTVTVTEGGGSASFTITPETGFIP